MKNIVLFHRLDLTDLYISLARELQNGMRVIHLAYSDYEVRKLQRAGIVSSEVINFKREITKIWEGEVRLDEQLLEIIDKDIIDQTDGAFNLNGIIQSDRGYQLLESADCNRLVSTYYKFWEHLIKKYKVDYVLHETPSLAFNVLAAILCSKHGGKYLYNIMVPTDTGGFDYLSMHGFDFSCDDIDNALISIEQNQLQIDQSRCENFLKSYREDLSVFLGSSVSRNANPLRLIAATMRNLLRLAIFRNKYTKYVDNIDYWELRRNLPGKKLINFILYKLIVKFSDFDESKKYYFYPLQLEPEAGVYYQGHGLYMNQIKLVQNIAAQLPPGCYLYVKDHPHDHGYRSAGDYRKLNKVPNVCLLKSEIPAKKVIFHSQGVMTITSTAGFEGLMLGKKVFTFGKTYYSGCPVATYIRNIRDLREEVYKSQLTEYNDETHLYPFLTAYFASIKNGLIDYYGGRAKKYGIDLEENAKRIASMIKHKGKHVAS